MIRLKTLGTTGLSDASGAELSGIVRQPKRFALLAYLALARPRDFQRRDTLLALFWPELDADRGRAALRQALYTLRRHLPAGTVTSRGDEEVGLSPGIWCDAWAFEAALATGDPETALDLYGGELLHGVHPPDTAPELGYWLDGERERFRRLGVGGARQLAEAARAAGDLEAVRRWASRAVLLDPMDEEGVRHQLALLDGAGDRAGALAAFDQWAKRLQEELDVEPAPETLVLVEEIRARDEPRSMPAQPKATRAVVRAMADAAPAGRGGVEPVASVPDPPNAESSEPPPTRARRWMRFAVGAGALVVLSALAAVLPLELSWRFGSAAPAETRVAVLPFDVQGDPSLGYLSDGLVYLLSVGLEGEDLRAVDPHALLRDTERSAAEGYDPRAGAAVADGYDADYFVLGNVVGSEERLRITAAVYRRGRPEPVVQSTTTGAGRDVLALVDELSGQILAGWRGRDVSRVSRVAAFTTDSLGALKSYLRGERLLRLGEFDSALAALQEAVLRDSTFALAFYRMSLAGSWAFRTDLASAAAEQAVRYAERLPEQERLLLTAHSAYRTGELAEAHRLAWRLTSLYPEDAEGWYRLGETQMHLGPLQGTPLTEARESFARAAALDSLRPDLQYHLAEIEAALGNAPAALLHVERALREAPSGARAPQLRVLRALVAGDRRDWEAQLAMLQDAPDFTVVSSTYMAAVFAARPRQARRIARLLTEPSRSTDTRAFGHLLLASLEQGLGRRHAAGREVAAMRRLDPQRADEAAALLGTTPWSPSDHAALRQLQARLERPGAMVQAPGRWWEQPPSLDRLSNLYARGLVAVALRDQEALDRARSELAHALQDTARAAELSAGLVSAFAYGTPDSTATPLPGPLRTAGAAEFAVLSTAISQPDRRFLQAQLLERRRRPREALAWYESLSALSVADLAYGIPALLDRARLHERLGEPEQAARLYRRFIDHWQAADPELRPRVEEARSALRRLERPAPT